MDDALKARLEKFIKDATTVPPEAAGVREETIQGLNKFTDIKIIKSESHRQTSRYVKYATPSPRNSTQQPNQSANQPSIQRGDATDLFSQWATSRKSPSASASSTTPHSHSPAGVAPAPPQVPPAYATSRHSPSVATIPSAIKTSTTQYTTPSFGSKVTSSTRPTATLSSTGGSNLFTNPPLRTSSPAAQSTTSYSKIQTSFDSPPSHQPPAPPKVPPPILTPTTASATLAPSSRPAYASHRRNLSTADSDLLKSSNQHNQYQQQQEIHQQRPVHSTSTLRASGMGGGTAAAAAAAASTNYKSTSALDTRPHSSINAPPHPTSSSRDLSSGATGSTGNRTSLLDDVRQACTNLSGKHSSARELARLLANPHMDALLEVHANVSKQQAEVSNKRSPKITPRGALGAGTGGVLGGLGGSAPRIAPIDDMIEMSVIEGSDQEDNADGPLLHQTRTTPTQADRNRNQLNLQQQQTKYSKPSIKISTSSNRIQELVDHPDTQSVSDQELEPGETDSMLEYQQDAAEIRIIGVSKTEEEPLGVTVKENGQGRLEVARILADGLVDRQGLMRVGDVILEVNSISVSTPDDLYDQLRKSKTRVTFKVIPSQREVLVTPSACFMRALFDYDPAEDSLLPCKSLGIGFQQGDILEVLNQDDPNWWQARRVDCPGSYTGLIPSQELEERRHAFVLPEFDYATKTNICGTRVSRKKETSFYDIQANPEFDKAELAIYEEVCRMPPFERKVLVLVGAQGVGRRTLKNRLCAYDPDRFDAPLPHTSRPIREGEVDGRQYHFVKQDIMNKDIDENQYLEWGEYNGHLYGVKLDSIRSIMASGKMCVIDCSPQCLKILKTAEFMPLIAFIGAPSIEQLRFMHEWGRNNDLGSMKNYTLDRAFGRQSRRARTLHSLHDFFEDEDLQGTVEESIRIQRAYERYFDMIIVNNNMEKTFEQLREALDSLSMEAQWVPISWIYQDGIV